MGGVVEIREGAASTLSIGPVWTRSRTGRSASAADGSSSSAQSQRGELVRGPARRRRGDGRVLHRDASCAASACASWAARSPAGRRRRPRLQPRARRRAGGRGARALLPFVFHELGCLHLELADPLLTRADVEPLRLRRPRRPRRSCPIPRRATRTRSSRACRARRGAAVRKSEKCGVTIEEAAPEGFADEYYEPPRRRLRQAASCGRRTVRARVERLIRNVHPSGDLLLLRARDRRRPEHRDRDLPGLQPPLVLLGQREPPRATRSLRPNEAIHWAAMRHWQARGMAYHDWGGGGDYKREVRRRPQSRRCTSALSRYAGDRQRRATLARAAYYLPRKIKRKRHLQRVDRVERVS